MDVQDGVKISNQFKLYEFQVNTALHRHTVYSNPMHKLISLFFFFFFFFFFYYFILIRF